MGPPFFLSSLQPSWMDIYICMLNLTNTNTPARYTTCCHTCECMDTLKQMYFIIYLLYMQYKRIIIFESIFKVAKKLLHITVCEQSNICLSFLQKGTTPSSASASSTQYIHPLASKELTLTAPPVTLL